MVQSHLHHMTPELRVTPRAQPWVFVQPLPSLNNSVHAATVHCMTRPVHATTQPEQYHDFARCIKLTNYMACKVHMWDHMWDLALSAIQTSEA